MQSLADTNKALLMADFAKDDDYQISESYSGLRDMVFNLTFDKIGMAPKQPDEVWGLLMETGYPKAVATLLALADGTVSLYFSNGGGLIGLGAHRKPAEAARAFLIASQQFVKQAEPVAGHPLPRPGFTRFYMLTPNGALTSEASENDLGNNRHPFSPLFQKGHAVIGAMRQYNESPRSQDGNNVPK